VNLNAPQAILEVRLVYRMCHGSHPVISNSRLCSLHSVYRPTIAPRRSRSRAPFDLMCSAPASAQDKAGHSNCHSGMSLRISRRPVRLLTPGIYQRTTSVFPQKFQFSTPPTPLQTRTMSDIKQISSQRAAQRMYQDYISSFVLG
jgi:hypothetical protein